MTKKKDTSKKKVKVSLGDKKSKKFEASPTLKRLMTMWQSEFVNKCQSAAEKEGIDLDIRILIRTFPKS